MPDDINITSTFDGSGINQFTVSVDEGVEVSKAMQQALDLLNDKAAVAASTSQELAEAWGILEKGAEKLNLQLVRTAAGFQIVQSSAQEATEKITAQESALAAAAVRLAAIDAGAGRMGYALSIAARTLGPMAGLFAAAFPAIFVVSMVEIVSTLADKLEQLRIQVASVGREFEDLTTSVEHHTTALELANLKTEDAISKLEGRPTNNRLVEALLEVRQAAQEAAKSLEEAEQKAITLLETKSIGFFSSLATGQEATKDITGSVEPQLVELANLRAKYAQLEQEQATAAVLNGVQTEIDTKRDAILAVLREKQKSTETSMADDVKEYDAWVAHEIKIGELKWSGLQVEEEHQKKVQLVNQGYAARNQILSQLIKLLEEEQSTEAVAGQRSIDIKKLAEEQKKTDAQKRTYTLQDPGLKEAEKTQTDLNAINKKAINDRYNEQVAGAQKEAAQAILAGQDKYKVEEDLANKVKALRETLTNDLVTQERDYLTKIIPIYNQEEDLIKRTKNGDEQTKALKTIEAEKAKIVRDGEAQIISLRTEGATSATKEVTAGLQKQVEAMKAAERDMVAAAKEHVREFSDDARNTEAEQVTAIKAGAETRIRTIKEEVDTRQISITQGRDRIVAIIQDEAQQVEAAMEREKQALIAQAQYIQALISTLPPASDAVKQLTQVYNQLEAAIKKAAAAQQEFGTKTKQAVTDTNTDALKRLTTLYEQMFQRIGDKFSGLISDMIVHGTTFSNAWRRLVLQLEADFIQALIRMLIRHLAAEAAKRVATATSQTAQTAATVGGVAARTSAEATGAATTQQISLIASIKQIVHSAAVAAAKAYEALAGIPVVGPALGAAAAAATFAAVIAFQALLGSAEKGAVLPTDMLIQAHAKEMILPANLSTGLQQMISNYSLGRSGPSLTAAAALGGESGDSFSFAPGSIQISTGADPRSIDRDMITRIIRKAGRDGAFR